MMYDLMLFFHLAALAVWLGSLLSLAIVTSISKGQTNSGEVRSLLRKVTGAFSKWIHPSSLIVLISGLIMLFNMNMSGGQPFWLIYMESAGMLIIILSIIILSLISNRKVRKPLAASNVEVTSVNKGLSIYLTLSIIFIILILSVIFVVAFKF